jgi:TPR repeat protein
MSKKQLALAISGALVVAGAAYLWLRARPKRQVAKTLSAPVQAPVRESVEELKLKADAGDMTAMCNLAILLLHAGIEEDVPRALELLHNAAESGGVEAMM